MKKALLANAGLKLSDSGGRTVVDKMYDLENNGDPTFTLSDRPEKHKTLDGVHQVCVEKEVTNFIGAGNYTFEGDWYAGTGVDVNIQQNQEIKGVTKKATRITSTTEDGGSSLKYRINGVGSMVEGESWTIQCLIHNIGVSNVRFRWTFGTPGEEVIVEPNEIKLCEITQVAISDADVRILIQTQESEDEIDIVAFQPQTEKSSYPTLFTEGTRLAPLPVIEDFTGINGAPFAISFWNDFIYQPETIGGIASGFHLVNNWSDHLIGLAYSNRHWVRFNGGSLYVSSITGYPLNDYERHTYFYHVQFDGNIVESYIGDKAGNLKKFLSVNESVNLTSGNWLLGGNTSSRQISNRFFQVQNSAEALTDPQVQATYLSSGKTLGFFNDVTFTDAT